MDTITNSDGDSHITNSNDATLGFELVTVDDFKIRVGRGLKEGPGWLSELGNWIT
jgi:hypothetical protein